MLTITVKRVLSYLHSMIVKRVNEGCDKKLKPKPR